MLRLSGYQVTMHRGYQAAHFGAPNPKFAPSTQVTAT
ncbi:MULTISPECIES: outer membrane family protein [unclassified Helicobacter]|nr:MULTISPECIES: outer membrane family protein [unclassified Helicobacter]